MSNIPTREEIETKISGHTKKPLPPVLYVRDRLNYDPLTGMLTWRKRAARMAPGSPAGGVSKSRGYVIVRIDNVSYQAHRIIWLYMTGEDPDYPN